MTSFYRQQSRRIAAQRELERERAQKERQTVTPRYRPTAIGYTSSPDLRDSICDAIVATALEQEPPEHARGWEGCGLRALANVCARGRATSDVEVMDEVLTYGVGDFPASVATVAHKVALDAYKASAPNYRAFSTPRPFADFRPHKVVRGDFPELSSVGEGGEFAQGELADVGIDATLGKFGAILDISRELLLADDVEAVARMARDAGAAAADFENRSHFEQCIVPNTGLGPELSDGNPVFDSAHSNIANAGALDLAKLSECRRLLKEQTSPTGRRLNTEAAVLLVAPQQVSQAEELVARLSPTRERLIVLSDASLSGTRFYVFAAPSRLANYLHGGLAGSQGPSIVTRNAFRFDGISLRLSHTFGCAALDFRAGVTGSGS